MALPVRELDGAVSFDVQVVPRASRDRRGEVTIVRGAAGRNKTVRVVGSTRAALLSLVEES